MPEDVSSLSAGRVPALPFRLSFIEDFFSAILKTSILVVMESLQRLQLVESQRTGESTLEVDQQDFDLPCRIKPGPL